MGLFSQSGREGFTFRGYKWRLRSVQCLLRKTVTVSKFNSMKASFTKHHRPAISETGGWISCPRGDDGHTAVRRTKASPEKVTSCSPVTVWAKIKSIFYSGTPVSWLGGSHGFSSDVLIGPLERLHRMSTLILPSDRIVRPALCCCKTVRSHYSA